MRFTSIALLLGAAIAACQVRDVQQAGSPMGGGSRQ